MELKLDEKEVKQALLDYANKQFPFDTPARKRFNEVKFDNSYSTFRGVTLSWSDVTEEEAAQAARETALLRNNKGMANAGLSVRDSIEALK